MIERMPDDVKPFAAAYERLITRHSTGGPSRGGMVAR
jgi:hypothetical protein